MADHGKVSVFISYATDDQALALTLRHALEATAVEVLGASELVPGERWEDSIAMMIRRADAYILIISPAFLKSAWLSRELDAILDEAERTRKRIIPLLAGGVRMEDVPPSLQRLQLLQISSDQSDLQTVLAPLKKVTRELEGTSTPAPAQKRLHKNDESTCEGGRPGFASRPRRRCRRHAAIEKPGLAVMGCPGHTGDAAAVTYTSNRTLALAGQTQAGKAKPRTSARHKDGRCPLHGDRAGDICDWRRRRADHLGTPPGTRKS